MKTNQKGFSVVEGLLVLLVVGLIGTVSWLVYDRQQNDNKQEPSVSNIVKTENGGTEESEDSSLPEGFTKFENKPNKISLGYPSDWAVDKQEPLSGYENSIVVFSSPSYKKGALPIGAEGVLSGTLVTVQTAQPKGTNVQTDYKEPKFGTDVTNFMIGGEKAVHYYVAYESAVYSHAVVYANGKQYDIIMQYPQNEGEAASVRKKYEPAFLKMLETVEFN